LFNINAGFLITM